VSEVRFTRAEKGRVRVEGRLEFETVDRALLERSRACFTGREDLVVDLAGVESGDSAGLALLIEWRAWAEASGRGLSFQNVPASLVGIADISDVSELLGLTAPGT
jgi:phospholipid transport system transporter-binding protein